LKKRPPLPGGLFLLKAILGVLSSIVASELVSQRSSECAEKLSASESTADEISTSAGQISTAIDDLKEHIEERFPSFYQGCKSAFRRRHEN
jgi:hypothetical protein